MKGALEPSVTFAAGPVMLRYVESSSWMVITAERMTSVPEVPPTMMVSSPSEMSSSTSVRTRVPEPLFEFAGMVTLAAAGPV